MNGTRTLNDAADLALHSLAVALHDRDSVDYHAILFRKRAYDSAGLPLVFTGKYPNLVSFFYMHNEFVTPPREQAR